MSLLYFRVAQIRRWEGGEERKSEGEGEEGVPRVRDEMNPERRRIERIPSVWVECGRAMVAWRARKAFWRAEMVVWTGIVGLGLRCGVG